MTVKQKFDKIDQSKLLQAQVDILKSMQTKTDNFKTKDKEALEKIEMGLDKIIAKLKESNPDALKSTARKTSTAGKAKAKTTSPSTTGGKNNVMALAKKIRKPNESWADAQKRAKASLQGDIKQASKVVSSELEKLKAFINRRKQLKGIAGTDLLRDATRKAKPKGSRTSKDGNVYYEYRENRTDRLAPNYPKNAPLLADGGGVEGIEEDIDMTDNYVLKVNKGVEPKDRASLREWMGKTNESREAMAYELGGAFMATDLAGNTGGGTGGLNADMPLSGVSGSKYTDLVGETGALSSGEMFEGGGSVGEELMGGQSNSTLKPSGYKLLATKGREIIVSDDEGKTRERWVKNNGFSGYRLVFKGNDYEFTDSFARGGGVRKVGNREYSLGRNWTNDHNHTNKSEKHEVGYSRKGMFDDGGVIDYSKQTSDDFKLGEIVWDVDNKTYGTIIGIYNQYPSDKYEIRLDSDGMQPTENLRKVGSKGDKGKKEQLDEAINSYARLRKDYPKNNYPKQMQSIMAYGGAMMANQQIIADASQQYVNYYLGEGATGGMYARGGMMLKPSTSKHRND